MARPPKIPYVAWRQGRPRFVPGESLRALGYRGEDLKRPDGAWMTAGEALDWATARAAEIEDKRSALASAAARRRPAGAKKVRGAVALYSLARLFEDWQRLEPRWGDGAAVGRRQVKPYSAATKRGYRWSMRLLEGFDHDLYHSAVAVLDPQILHHLYLKIWERHGLASARAAIAAISTAISWGRLNGRLQLAENPASHLRMTTPDPRVRVGEREEIAALVAAADKLGRPEIGDMVILGVWTGQRQGDRLALVDRGLVRGRRVFRQAKTGAIVAVLEAPELERRLAAARARRESAGIVDARIVLDEQTWRPFKADHYRHVFAEVRTAAAKKCPSVATLRDQDLRDTAVTWMALGGATIPEIIAVSGHSAVSAQTILKHYLARHPELADAAIGKMVAWYVGGEEMGVTQ